MKKSTQVYWIGLVAFTIGSVLVQQEISTALYIGMVMIMISWTLVSAHVDLERLEKDYEDMLNLRKDIEAKLLEMANADKSKVDEFDENDFIKKSEQ